MLYLYFVNSLIINKQVIITRFDDFDWQLIAKSASTLRLSLLGQKESYNIFDNNVAVIEPDGTDTYRIRFGSEKYMYKKKNDSGVIAINIEHPLAVFEGRDGFIWRIKEKEDYFNFESRGKCLEMRSQAEDKDNLYVNGQDCKPNFVKQKFKIQEATITGKPEDRDLPGESEPPVKTEEDEDQKVINVNVFIKRKRPHKHSHHCSEHKKRRKIHYHE